MPHNVVDQWWFKAFAALLFFFLIQVYITFSKVESFNVDKMTLDAEVASLERKRDEIRMNLFAKERDIVRMEKKVSQLELLVKDRTSLISSSRAAENTIYFITPTHFRPGQKADMTRLSYTLSHVPKLHWIVVEDSGKPTDAIRRILVRSKVQFTHLNTLTPPEHKMKYSQPNWYIPRGVEQRNLALDWLRTQLKTATSGAIYFGDDDNTYDLRLFQDIRNVKQAGVWPVGIVGGLFVETPILLENGTVAGFNAMWKPERPFPIDMAAFAVNISLILSNPKAGFKFDVPRGYQESQFLQSLGLNRADLEPLAKGCSKVFVWHTRTEKPKFERAVQLRITNPNNSSFSPLESEALEKMGERKGQNFYYPPDFNYKVHKSLNKYHGTHALRERAAKLGQGILIIRFEMPFNIWCLGCHNHVGMGVRYNAEKKKVGHYYTTPLFEFRMKCHLCDNYFVIRTDPKNFDYELVEGCSRQEKRYDPSTIQQLGAVDRTLNLKLGADAMFKAEHDHDDKKVAESEETRVEKLEWLNERMRDDFAANSILRARFRNERKDLNEQRAKDNDLLARSSLSIKLLPDTPEDQKVASMLKRYSDVKSFDERQEDQRSAVNTRRIFYVNTPSTSSPATDPISSAEQLKRNLKQDRDRKINEQFNFGASSKKAASLGIVKKRRKLDEAAEIKPGDIQEIKIEMPEPAEQTGIKPELIPKEEPSAGGLQGLLADYGGSSDSD